VDRARAVVGLAVACVALAGCSVRTASLSDAHSIPPPTFSPPPAAPAESRQLDVIVERDTAGLANDDPDADATQLAPALAAMRAAFPETELIGDIYIIDRSVYMTIADLEVPGRAISIHYDDDLSVGEPQFDDGTGLYPIERVDPDALVALVSGLAARYPTMKVDTPRLDVGLSYGLGLAWRMDLDDVRGTLATIWADLDGTVIAVDTAES
jgi:hypothetical protein